MSDTNDRPLLLLGCLGHLGQFGNQLFQYAFFRILADENSFRRLCPPWLGSSVFETGDEPMAAASPALPLVADRVVLSHVGWRRYAATREPAVSLIRAAGGLPLSDCSERVARQGAAQTY